MTGDFLAADLRDRATAANPVNGDYWARQSQPGPAMDAILALREHVPGPLTTGDVPRDKGLQCSRSKVLVASSTK